MNFLKICVMTLLAVCVCSNPLFGQLFVQGNWVAIVTNTFSNNVVRMSSTQDVSDLNPGFKFPYGVAISPDGLSAYVVSSNDNAVLKVDIATNQVVDSVSVGLIPNFIAINSSGTKAYVTNKGDGTISILDLTRARLSVIQTFASDGRSASSSSLPTGIALSSDNKTLYVVNQGLVPVLPQLTSFNLTNPQFPVRGTSVQLFAVVPNYIVVTSQAASEQKLYLTDQNSANPKATVYAYLLTNPLRPSLLASITIEPSFPAGMVLSSNGTRLYAVGQNIGTQQAISVIDTQTNRVVGNVPFSSPVSLSDIKISPDEKSLLVTDRLNSGVHVVDLTANPPQVIDFITTGSIPLGIAITGQ